LHEYISHHRIYTAEVAGIVKNEDHKWQAALAEKDRELEELKSVVAQQEEELQMLRERTAAPVSRYERRRVSRTTFNAMLVVLFLVGGLAAYSLLFNKSVVGAANTAKENTITDRIRVGEEETNNRKVSENNSSAKGAEKLSEKQKKQIASDSARQAEQVLPNENTADEQQDSIRQETTQKDEPVKTAEEKKEEQEETANNEIDGVTRYKVRNKAFFHDEPDAGTKRAAFIIHWNNAVLKPLDEKNGFIYVVFTNHLGQTSKGWLSKDDLVPVK
jgi:eukaryotic-like serine/threonine-protein kinase